MIWLWIAVLAALAVAPLVYLGWRGARIRGRQEAAMALHRAQLRELDLDLADGRLVAEEHAAAKLEVQRRLLADAALADGKGAASGPGTLVLVGLLVPMAALILYLRIGHPDFPPRGDATSPSEAASSASDAAKAAKDDALIEQLRARLRLMDPHAPRTLEGYEILGRAELTRGRLPEAAEAWKTVLADRFDATLAVQTAEVLTEAAGKITPEALALFKRALAEAPADAPWRPMAQKRIAEAGG
ncbi:MAG: c-type cytochrome biogenesis protein CcmI [Rhodospirillales bacterium]